MSVLQVANVHLNSAGSSRIETTDGGANVRIVIESANVMYANPARTVFPGNVYVGNNLIVGNYTYASYLEAYALNVAVDVGVTGNVFTNSLTVANTLTIGGVVQGNGATTFFVNSNGTPTFTGLPASKVIRVKIAGGIGASGSGTRFYISSDNGSTYSVLKAMTSASHSNGHGEIIITNADQAGVNKVILLTYAFTSAAGCTATIFTETGVTGVINAFKCNTSGGSIAGAFGVICEA